MTTTELTSILSLVAVVGGGTLWLETRYAQREDIKSLEKRIDAMSISAEVGHAILKFEAILEAKEDDLSDLRGTDMLYRALSQAGAITSEQTRRWETVQRDLAEKQEEIRELRSDLQRLVSGR